MKKRILIDANLIRDMLSVCSLKAMLSMECDFCTIDGVLRELKKVVVSEVFNRIRNFNKLNIVDLEDSLADDVLSFHESLSNKMIAKKLVYPKPLSYGKK